MGDLSAKIYLDRLEANIDLVQSKTSAGVGIIAVVKNDAYGHGAKRMAAVIAEKGIRRFAVSSLDEALELRSALPDVSILVLGEIAHRDLTRAVEERIILALSRLDAARELAGLARNMGVQARVHVKVDTGMGRFGMMPGQAASVLRGLAGLPGMEVEGLYSHLGATFNTDEDSNDYTLGQIKSFELVCSELEQEGLLPEVVHIGSSTALLGFPASVAGGFFNHIRIGTLFFGYQERPGDWPEHVRPIAEVSTEVRLLRDLPAGHCVGYGRLYTTPREMRVAVLPVGYGQGYHRDLGNKGEVLIGDGRAGVLGKPSLGQILVDVSSLKSVAEGDRVLLAGEALPAYEQGKAVGRGTWELLLPLLEHSERTYAREIPAEEKEMEKEARREHA